MPEPSTLERLTKLEAERDALRLRLESFERGEEDLAYRTELAQLQTQADQLSADNAELRRQISASRARKQPILGPLTRMIEGLLQRIIDRDP